MLRKMKKFFRNMIKFLKKGGITVAEINQISWGDCLSGKKAFITGGSSGIGFAIAKKLHDMGAIVLISGRNEEKLKTSVKGFSRMSYIVWDITEESSYHEKINEVIALMGDIDVFVNNAGVYVPKHMRDIEVFDWNRVVDTNLKGAYFVEREVILHLIEKKKKGKIVNVVSNRGFLGDDGPYGASKWGIRGLTIGLARDYIKNGIIINGVAPGTTATDISGIDPFDNIYDEREANCRISVAEEIAEIVGFLASGASENIVGQIIVCDGGSSLK